jgi:putative nucleotidyltransferase with HDIG domain
LASQLRIQDEDRDRLRWAALLHDIGKLHVPARILNKPGRPEPREWESLKAHPAAGARIARPLLSWLGPWADAIEQHHERFDGGGYPNGLEREGISLAARIVSVADSFEVMTAARSYKKPMSVPAARRELAACAGGQFDTAIVRAFLNVWVGSGGRSGRRPRQRCCPCWVPSREPVARSPAPRGRCRRRRRERRRDVADVRGRRGGGRASRPCAHVAGGGPRPGGR